MIIVFEKVLTQRLFSILQIPPFPFNQVRQTLNSSVWLKEHLRLLKLCWNTSHPVWTASSVDIPVLKDVQRESALAGWCRIHHRNQWNASSLSAIGSVNYFVQTKCGHTVRGGTRRLLCDCSLMGNRGCRIRWNIPANLSSGPFIFSFPGVRRPNETRLKMSIWWQGASVRFKVSRMCADSGSGFRELMSVAISHNKDPSKVPVCMNGNISRGHQPF